MLGYIILGYIVIIISFILLCFFSFKLPTYFENLKAEINMKYHKKVEIPLYEMFLHHFKYTYEIQAKGITEEDLIFPLFKYKKLKLDYKICIQPKDIMISEAKHYLNSSSRLIDFEGLYITCKKNSCTPNLIYVYDNVSERYYENKEVKNLKDFIEKSFDYSYSVKVNFSENNFSDRYIEIPWRTKLELLKFQTKYEVSPKFFIKDNKICILFDQKELLPSFNIESLLRSRSELQSLLACFERNINMINESINIAESMDM